MFRQVRSPDLHCSGCPGCRRSLTCGVPDITVPARNIKGEGNAMNDFDREFTRFLVGLLVTVLVIAAVCWTVSLGMSAI